VPYRRRQRLSKNLFNPVLNRRGQKAGRFIVNLITYCRRPRAGQNLFNSVSYRRRQRLSKNLFNPVLNSREGRKPDGF
jgi:hypothetical protein